MSAEQNKSIVRRWVEGGWNGGDLALIDQLLAPDYVLHDPQAPVPITSSAAFKEFVTAYRTALPDMHMTVDDLIAEGDKVVWRFTARGTHDGPLMSLPPSGRPVVTTGIVISRFVDGKWAEDWLNFDLLGMLQQIGVIPALA